MSHSKSSGLSLRGSGSHQGHTVTMIELGAKVDAVRRSKIAFWAVGSTVGVSAGVIASAITEWPLAVLIGLLTGAIVGFLVGLGLFCWPAIRVVWHWLAEIVALVVVLTCYVVLTGLVPWWAALAILAVVLVGPFGVPGVRPVLWPWVCCAVTRHRLRVCFAAFVASQRTGMTPLILLARPIPAGERVWIWLRPGLALADLEARMDRLAAGCWAAECRIAPASRRYAALLRLDVARRNPLIGMVGSPLPGLVPATVDPDVFDADVSTTGLDLPDTPDIAPVETVAPKRRLKAVTATPAAPEPVLSDLLTPSARGREDLSDWI